MPVRALGMMLALALLPAGSARILAEEAGAAGEPGLVRYVRRPDPSFAWKEVAAHEREGAVVHALHLTSQTWKGRRWEHALTVLRPDEARGDTAILVVAGGSNRPGFERKIPSETELLLPVARLLGATVAVLRQVPNQPLFGGKHEDEIIAHTFHRFLETGDETWPLLLPMAKAAVRAMDALQEFSEQKLGARLARFLVTGASKRGWTTWLTAAADERVAAAAPMVIDMLNLPVQMPHQLACWGAYSEQIRDYTRLGIQQRMGDSRGPDLLRLVDPYFVRDRIRAPVFILLGTNDRYWPADAARHYFFDLPGPAFLRYFPNAGHGLDMTVVPVVASVYRLVTASEPLPSFSWDFEEDGHTVRLRVRTDAEARGASLWSARAPYRDFRAARWEESQKKEAGRTFAFPVTLPEKGWIAFYASIAFPRPGGGTARLCTTLRSFARPGQAPFEPRARGEDGAGETPGGHR